MDRIPVTRSSVPSKEEYFQEISSIWDSHWLTNMGEKHNQLEVMLKEYLRVPKISLFSNGHMALELAIQALNLKGEVITTPYTFASTTHAIVRNGLKPVFCDINPETYTIDVSQIEKLITAETCAILPVHVYGNICDVNAIQKIADKYNLKVIYDAAHAFGVTYDGNGIGKYGNVSMFSFHATKVYNTIEGGAICYRDEDLGERLYQLKNFGIKDQESVIGIGANAKMNEFQAAMGICNLRHIEEELEKRRFVFNRYMENLDGVKGIKLPKIQDRVKSNYAYFPVVFNKREFGKSRDEVFQQLEQQGIFTRKYFYPITSEYECYSNWFDSEKTPVALKTSQNVLTLPMYADLDLLQVDRICREIIK